MSNTRDAYVKKMKAKLDEWNAEIAGLEAEAKQKQADIQERYNEQIEVLKTIRKSTEEELDNLRQAGESAWKELRAGFENAAGSLKYAIQSAQSKLKQ
ncbi:MAG: hypothetical protein K9L30_07470 [Desulfobacterales bacterium]|nr:hypothetical protein [Desulfobacterales bacterium]